MILLSVLVTARWELSFLLHPPLTSPSVSYFFCYLYTKPSRVVAVLRQRWCYDDGGDRCSSSRKSQINPFVIPHRSFQPVRISTTLLLCHLRTLPKLFPLSLPSPNCPVKRERDFTRILPFLSVLPLTLPYFRHFFPSYPFFSTLAASSLGHSLGLSLSPLISRSRIP